MDFDLQKLATWAIRPLNVLDSNTRDDCISTACVAILAQIRKCESNGRRTSTGYLVQCGRKAALRYLRQQQKHGHVPLFEETGTAPEANADAAMDVKSILKRCELTREKRELIRLRFVDGLSYSKIAERLGKPKSTIAAQGKRLLEKLKGCTQ